MTINVAPGGVLNDKVPFYDVSKSHLPSRFAISGYNHSHVATMQHFAITFMGVSEIQKAMNFDM